MSSDAQRCAARRRSAGKEAAAAPRTFVWPYHRSIVLVRAATKAVVSSGDRLASYASAPSAKRAGSFWNIDAQSMNTPMSRKPYARHSFSRPRPLPTCLSLEQSSAVTLPCLSEWLVSSQHCACR